MTQGKSLLHVPCSCNCASTVIDGVEKGLYFQTFITDTIQRHPPVVKTT
jgi:hypothetical protein